MIVEPRRGPVFLQLMTEYRGHHEMTPTELKRIKEEYYMDRYVRNQGVSILRQRIHHINQNCLFLCALQLGDDFGHIYVIEKIYPETRSQITSTPLSIISKLSQCISID